MRLVDALKNIRWLDYVNFPGEEDLPNDVIGAQLEARTRLGITIAVLGDTFLDRLERMLEKTNDQN